MEGRPISNFGLLDSDDMPPPEQPPLRTIDKYIKPECPCLSKRYTVAVLTCLGELLLFEKQTFTLLSAKKYVLLYCRICGTFPV